MRYYRNRTNYIRPKMEELVQDNREIKCICTLHIR